MLNFIIPAAGKSSRFNSSVTDKCLARVHNDAIDNQVPLIVDTLIKIDDYNSIPSSEDFFIHEDIRIGTVFIICNLNNEDRIRKEIDMYKSHYQDLEIIYYQVNTFDGEAAAIYKLMQSSTFKAGSYESRDSIIMWSDVFIADVDSMKKFVQDSFLSMILVNARVSIATEICKKKNGVPYCIINQYESETTRQTKKNGGIGPVHSIKLKNQLSTKEYTKYKKYLNGRYLFSLFSRKSNYLLHDLSIFYIAAGRFEEITGSYLKMNKIDTDPLGTYSKDIRMMNVLDWYCNMVNQLGNFEEGLGLHPVKYNSCYGSFTETFNTLQEYNKIIDKEEKA